jgi:hypothetical protein
MSMTLHTMLTLHGWAAHHNMSETLDILARGGRGGGGRSTHFFFFGGGVGSATLAVPIAIIAIFGGYLMRNPDKARGLKDRLRGAWGAAATGLNSRLDPHSGMPPYAPPHQSPAPAEQNVTAHPPNAHPANGHHFHSAPQQPVIGGQLGSSPESPQSLPAPKRPAPTAGVNTPQPLSAPGAAMRFNAPPGWPVPPEWTPAPDWKPDPSWPPAPPGWTFWVPAGASRPVTTQRFAAGTTYSGTRPSDFQPRNG